MSLHGQSSGTLSISVATSSTDLSDPFNTKNPLLGFNASDFAPHYGLAIWIEDKNGKFVRTLSLWCPTIRKGWLENWTKATNQNINGLTLVPAPLPTDPQLKLPQPDGTTGATLTNYGTLTCTWNGKDLSGNEMPDDTYKLQIELTDNDPIVPIPGENGTTTKGAGGKLRTIVFAKGPNSATFSLAEAATVSCLGIYTVKWTPSSTGINNVELNKLYSIYPNPAKEHIFVNGLDIQQVEILTQEGKSILKSNQQRININALSKGIYVIQISTPKGLVVKKLIKQ